MNINKQTPLVDLAILIYMHKHVKGITK